MNVLRQIIDELIGLFLDDVLLAIATLVVVAVAAIASFALHLPLLAGGFLVVGCVGALVVSAFRGD